MEKYFYIDELVNRYPELECVHESVVSASDILASCFSKGGKMLIAGNGGSAADSEHIVGELMKGFVKSRRMSDDFARKLAVIDSDASCILKNNLQQGLPAIALCGHPALSTAYLNDVDGTIGFAQQVYGYGKEGDVFFAISTSGNSQNVIYAAITAKAKGMSVIGLTGSTGGRLKNYCDEVITVPASEAYKVQEYHLPVYHAICLELEERFF